MKKLKVLFVDDEPNVLSGLRRMLRGLRDQWEMEFLDSGEAAQHRMRETPFDVVVSDMRMPGIDGVSLLTHVLKEFPSTARIILSGYADKAALMRAVTPAHQFLSKPCNADVLKSSIERTRKLQEMLKNDSLIQFVSSVTQLPSLPNVYSEVVCELQNDSPSLDRITELICSDVSMAAKVLQLVHSSFFGFRGRVESIRHAVVLLGICNLQPLVLTGAVFSQFDHLVCDQFDVTGLFERSKKVNVLAERFANQHSNDRAILDDVRLASPMLDVGKLVMIAGRPNEYNEAIELSNSTGMYDYEAERAIFGVGHPEVGAYLLGLWGVPDSIVDAVAFHHEPHRSLHSGFSPLTATYWADQFQSARENKFTQMMDQSIDADYLISAGIVDYKTEWCRWNMLELSELAVN